MHENKRDRSAQSFNHISNVQSWLSLIDIEQAIEEHSCTYKHTGKDVTAAKDTNIAVIPQTNQLIDRFIDQIRIRAVKARYYKTTLVILAFGPVTPEQDLCFGLEEDSFINTHQLRQAILAGEEFDIPVILLTPSVFTSGWAVNPVLCGSSHFAAKRNVKLISLSCGSVFAADLTHKFTERTTPLLKDSERAKIPYDDLMPIYPSNEQRQLRDTLHTSIHQTLIQRVPQLAPGHFFDFSAKHDAWEVYAPRRGRSLRFWRDKWGPSSIASPVPPAVASSLGSAFGGTVESQVFHVRFLARLEIHTSRKDRFNIKTQKTNQLLELSQHPYLGVQHVLKDVFEAIEFRAARISLVSLVAKYLDLPFPNGMKCRFWGEVMEDGPQRDAWVHLMGVFSPCALPPGINRTDHNDITYWKPVAWLAAAIGSKFKNNSRQDIEAFIAQQVKPGTKLTPLTNPSSPQNPFSSHRPMTGAFQLPYPDIRDPGLRGMHTCSVQ